MFVCVCVRVCTCVCACMCVCKIPVKFPFDYLHYVGFLFFVFFFCNTNFINKYTLLSCARKCLKRSLNFLVQVHG